MSALDNRTVMQRCRFQYILTDRICPYRNQQSCSSFNQILLTFRIIADHNNSVLDLIVDCLCLGQRHNGNLAVDMGFNIIVDNRPVNHFRKMRRICLLQKFNLSRRIAQTDISQITSGHKPGNGTIILQYRQGIALETAELLYRFLNGCFRGNEFRRIQFYFTKTLAGILQ